MRITIPNQITLARLLLAIVFFALLSFYSAADQPPRDWILGACFWIFVVAAVSDVVDGWLARSWGQVTAFGRVCDPVADKVIVCGAFVFFASALFYDPATGRNITGVAPWMAVLILLRELLVSALRAFSESAGVEFGANWIGKTKMLVQSVAIGLVLGVLSWLGDSWQWLSDLFVWLTVIVTALSIIAYLGRARALVLSAHALGGTGHVPDARRATT